MTNALALQHKKLYIKCTKHTHYHLRCKIDQYISVNNILLMKFCFAVEPSSEGSVRLWALCQRYCGLLLRVAVKPVKDMVGVVPGWLKHFAHPSLGFGRESKSAKFGLRGVVIQNETTYIKSGTHVGSASDWPPPFQIWRRGRSSSSENSWLQNCPLNPHPSQKSRENTSYLAVNAAAPPQIILEMGPTMNWNPNSDTCSSITPPV